MMIRCSQRNARFGAGRAKVGTCRFVSGGVTWSWGGVGVVFPSQLRYSPGFTEDLHLLLSSSPQSYETGNMAGGWMCLCVCSDGRGELCYYVVLFLCALV